MGGGGRLVTVSGFGAASLPCFTCTELESRADVPLDQGSGGVVSVGQSYPV